MRPGDGGSEARRLDATFDHDISSRRVMHQRRAERERAGGADHRRQLFDLDLDQLGDVLGLLAARRHHRRDRLADEPHHVLRQDGLADQHVVELVQHGPDRLDRGEIGGRNDGRTDGRRDT